MLITVLIVTPLLGSITNTVSTLSNYNTLVDNVNYDLSFDFSGDTISAGSKVNVLFSNSFILTSVSGCKARTTSGGAFVNPTCSVTQTANGYTVTFDGLFSSSTTLIFLELQVQEK